ncbi:MAG: hypothetical protein AAF404_21155, partial [Pseudomonadota bacterium]
MPGVGKQAVALMSIYDAASNSEAWNESLDACVDYVQAHGANIMFHENDAESRWHYTLGSHQWRQCTPEQLARTVDFFNHYDSHAWAYVHQHRNQTIHLDTDYWKETESLSEREDYVFFREQLGFERKLGIKLNDNLCWTDNLSFQFAANHPQVPDESLQRILDLLPHVAKSVELWRTFSILKSHYKAVLSALDHVRVGLCVVEPGGTVVVANEQAKRIFDLGSAIRMGKDKRIHCRSGEAEASIQQSIRLACATSSGDNSVAETLQLFSIDNATQVSVEVTPLRDGDAEIDSQFSGALITLVDLTADLEIDCSKIAAAYKLSTT